MPSKRMSSHDKDDEPILPLQDVSGEEHTSHVMGRTKVTVIKEMEATLGETEYKMMLEVTGVNSVGDRPGIDFVTVLDVDPDNLEIVELAMKFLVQKLNSDDRLSIIIVTVRPTQILPLRQIKESFEDEVESVVSYLRDVCRDITACVKKGQEVLSDRHFTTGRKAAIMLMSNGIHNFYDYGIPQVQFRNIPIYTFGLGEDCDPWVLKKISNETMGVTYSCLRNSNELSIAFSQCFADLFGVATRDLKLTVKQIESTILNVFAGNYTQSTDNALGIITINFEDLYVNELRKIAVDLCLPAVKSHCSNDVLEISFRYRK